MGAALLQAHALQNIGHTVADGGGGGKGEVHNAEGDAKPPRGLLGHQLAHAGDLKGRALNELGQLGQVLSAAGLLNRRPDHAGAGNPHVDHTVRFSGAVEGSRHKGIVLRGVAEHHQLCGADAFPVGSALGGLLDHAAHLFHGVHIDARLGRAHVHRGADKVRFAESLGNALDQGVVPRAKALLD